MMMQPAIKLGAVSSRDDMHHSFMWTDAQGQRHCKRVVGTLSDVEIERARITLGLSRQAESNVPQITFGVYWEIAVLPALEGREALTKEWYGRIWGRVLAPLLGDMPLHSLTWRTAESMLNSIPSPATARAASRVLKRVCYLAMRDGLIVTNPVCRLNLRPVPKQKKRLLSACEVQPWLDGIRGMKYEPMLLAMLGGGTRVEEACALRWEDVEPFDHRGKRYARVRIERALVIVPNHGKLLKATKTQGSTRDVIIGEPFSARLLELSKGRGVLCPARNGATFPDGYAYTEADYTSPQAMTRNVRAWCERRNVEYIRPKDLRSNYATLHGEAFSPDGLVSLSMGHADGDGTTRGKHYQQTTVDGLCMLADNLGGYLSRVMQTDAEMPENGAKLMQNCIISSVA